jgi:hypothetical protein
MFCPQLDSVFAIKEIRFPNLQTMPWRYTIFSILILAAAFGASKRLVGMSQQDGQGASAKLPVTSSQKISGRSIAPGGAGGRQS